MKRISKHYGLGVLCAAVLAMSSLGPNSAFGEDSATDLNTLEQRYRIEKKEMQERHQQERLQLEERYKIQRKEMKDTRKEERKSYRDDRSQRRDDNRGFSGKGRDDRGPDDSGRRGR
ncbi:hypothetical protein [Geoalkalibacter halelectricus]|uniref:Uncharacterized protein n=1 Tax=Geoalkalibacter halelectricus TaxID=2847045 RepID=A0ABY5ZPE0_9BACT|nr:hypothetical protein [Geoalkalibacter halelectricus]MDO3379975.1 hypothetical protein [Geoalkalibacter halelectricus]UWZ80498.1 hypothetical protein L9S41_03640 [Geoalkalibacter halelectricus]